MEKLDKIEFQTENGVEEFYVLDETRISGCNYLLVVDSMEEEAEALILKDIAGEESSESIYEIVEDDNELTVVAELFKDSLGDVDFI